MIGIVVLNYRNWRSTIECVESILKSDNKDFEIIIVDNNSSNKSKENLLAWANGDKIFDYVSLKTMSHYSLPPAVKPLSYLSVEYCNGSFTTQTNSDYKQLIFIWSDINQGYASGNNIAIKYSQLTKRYDYFWILNNDTVIESDTLGKLISYTKNGANMNYGIIGCDEFSYYDYNKLRGIGGYMHPLRLSGVAVLPKNYNKTECEDLFCKRAHCVYGGSLFVKADFIYGIGLMCEDYFLYYEELDWAIRGKRKGWECGYCFGAKVYHKGGESIGSGSNANTRSDLADYYGIRSRVIFVKKYYPRKILLLILSLFISFIRRLRPGYIQRAFGILSIIKQELIERKN
jgi:GT2 family glycosyltransferase